MDDLPDILKRMTLKHRKTAAWTSGDTGTVRRHSERRSIEIMSLDIMFCYYYTCDIRHLPLVLVNIRAEDDPGQPLQKQGSLLLLQLLAAEDADVALA